MLTNCSVRSSSPPDQENQGVGGQDQGWTNPNLQPHHISALLCCESILLIHILLSRWSFDSHWEENPPVVSDQVCDFQYFQVTRLRLLKEATLLVRTWSDVPWRPDPKAAGGSYLRSHLSGNFFNDFKNFRFNLWPAPGQLLISEITKCLVISKNNCSSTFFQ